MDDSRAAHAWDTDSPVPEALTAQEWQSTISELHLSPQQASIVALILSGKRDKQIAQQMGRSIWTIRTHLRHIFARLGVADRTELVLTIFRGLRR